MSELTETIRRTNFDRRSLKETILRANERYLHYYGLVEAIIYGKENQRHLLEEKFGELEAAVDEAEAVLRINPNEYESIETIREKGTLRDMIFGILMNTRNDDIEKYMSLIKIQKLDPEKRLSDIEGLFAEYEQKGIAVFKDQSGNPIGKSNLVDAIDSINDYQIAILSSDMELPGPLSQAYLKEPDLKRDDAVTIFVQYLAANEFRGTYGTDIDKALRTGERRQEALELLENPDLLKKARAATKGLPRFGSLDILSRRVLEEIAGKTEIKKYLNSDTSIGYDSSLIHNFNITPELAFETAMGLASKDTHYLRFQFLGFGEKPEDQLPKVWTLRNNSVGIAMSLFSEMLADGSEPDVDIDDIIEITKPYADNVVVGKIMSRSEIRSAYDVRVFNLSMYSPGDEIDLSTWTLLRGNCPCRHSTFISQVQRRKLDYGDMHVIGLARTAYMAAINNEGKMVHNQIAIPTLSQHEYDNKIQNQVLVQRRLGGQIKPPNVGEQTCYGTRNAMLKGPEASIHFDLKADCSYLLTR